MSPMWEWPWPCLRGPEPPSAAAAGQQHAPAADGSAIAAKASHADAVHSDDELAIARTLLDDLGEPPSDSPSASCISRTAQCRVWRCPTQAAKFDEYVLEFELPVGLESFVTMTSSPRLRTTWDSTTAYIRVLSAEGPTVLQKLHAESGDIMTLSWGVNTPFPFSNRQYVMTRRLGVVPGVASAYFLVDLLVPPTSPPAAIPTEKYVRVRDYCNYCLMVLDEDTGCVRVRTRYREDPMISLPSWLIGWITEKLLPGSVRTLIDAALKFEASRSDLAFA